MKLLNRLKLYFILSSLIIGCSNQPVKTIEITIKDHKFIPNEVIAYENEKIKLKIINLDDSTEEFESIDLNREKLILANSSANINVGELKAGVYEFVGEFNKDTAKGSLIIKESKK